MPRKKTKKVEAVETQIPDMLARTSPAILKGPVVVDGTLYLSPYDLARLELLQQRHLNKRQALELTRSKTRELHARYESELATLRAEEGQALMHAKSAEREIEVLRLELEKLYSLDFSVISYNPTTGQLTLHEKPIPFTSPASVLGKDEVGDTIMADSTS